ncbi:hypothetical protein ACFQ9X_42130 [Catenulispora yoronensis]
MPSTNTAVTTGISTTPDSVIATWKIRCQSPPTALGCPYTSGTAEPATSSRLSYSAQPNGRASSQMPENATSSVTTAAISTVRSLAEVKKRSASTARHHIRVVVEA